jgi:SNF2 family DNA or RNA helicase
MPPATGFGNDNNFMKAFRKTCSLKIDLCCKHIEKHWIPRLLHVDQNSSHSQDSDKTPNDIAPKQCLKACVGVGQVALGSATPPFKLAIFAHHKAMLDAVQVLMEAHRIGYVRIDGKTGRNNVQPAIDKFQTCVSCQVALLSLTAAGTGITLTAAHHALVLELLPKTDTILQAEERLHRIGQTRPVEIHYLLVPHSIDEVTWRITQMKHNNLSVVVDGKQKGFHAARAPIENLDACGAVGAAKGS